MGDDETTLSGPGRIPNLRVLPVIIVEVPHGAGGAAELLGVNPNTLRNKMNKLVIEYKKNIPRA